MLHKYTMFGYYIALDVESGAVHSLTEPAYRMLDYIELMLKKDKTLPERCPMDLRYQLARFESGSLNDAYMELVELYKDGLLFSEAADVTIRYADDIPLKAMCLHISHDCNMKCGYCFAKKGDFGLKRSVMSEETGLRAFEFLIDNSKGKRNLEVDFFGGEPLLNFSTVKKVIARAREVEAEKNKNIRFTLTTNGTLLDDETIDYISENIYNIVLSLDGNKFTNDKMRTYNDDSSTYDDLIPKYKKLVDKRGGKDYYIRGTFTRYNLDFVNDVQHIADLGFKNISVEPVVTEEANDYSIRKEDLPAVFAEYEKLAKIIIKNEKKGENTFNFFHFNVDLEGGPCVYKRIKGCGSGSEYIAVTPEGDIYPCHQFVGIEEYKLGSVLTNEMDKSRMQEFLKNNITTNPECKNCWSKYFCGGGCAANNVKFNDDIEKPYSIACEMEKKRVECAIAIKVVRA